MKKKKKSFNFQARMVIAIRQVWGFNLHEELKLLYESLPNFPIVAIDTEFPGFLKCTPRDSLEAQRYDDLRFNVNRLKPIQLGFTLCNQEGTIGGVWQVNLKFDLDVDLYVQNSIDLLRKNGVNFEKHKRDGIDPYLLTIMFKDLMATHGRNIQWITFHGLYDFGYFLKLAVGKPLPECENVFIRVLGEVFGHVYDLKFMARFCQGLLGGELGLARMAKILKVERVGESHQAGSDSYVTACAFLKMKEIYGLNERMHQGFLYGIEARIERRAVRRRPVVVVPFPTAYFGHGYGHAIPVMKVQYLGRPMFASPVQRVGVPLMLA